MATPALAWVEHEPTNAASDGPAADDAARTPYAAGRGPGLGPQWSTSSFGHSTHTTPLELCELGHHLQQCQGGNRRLRTLQRGAQALHGFVAPRFISTLAVVLLGAGLLWVLL